MRIYLNFTEAMGEIKRDLAEMGIRVHPQTYQDKYVGDNPDFATMELQNYIYTVINPVFTDLNPTQPWADQEFEERIKEPPVNPGEAWKFRREIWEQFLEPDGKFAYTYSERMSGQIMKIAKRVKEDPDSRQAYLAIWNPEKDIDKLGGISRVPCSLGYLFQVRRKRLNMTYLQRSADFVTHFVNDVYLAVRLQNHMSQLTGFPLGTFTHWVGSLHIFQKDVKGVF